jgi:hypothetical protein
MAPPDMLQSNQPFAFEVTPEFCVRHLAKLWAKELGQDSSLVLEAVAAEKRESHNTPVVPMAAARRASLVKYNGLPPKEQAQQWLTVFLNGPNKLFCICAQSESEQLLDFLYGPEDEISRNSACLILFQLAVGSRFAEDTPEHVYTSIHETARRRMEECIEEDNGILLWIVPVLLLSCIYWMNTKAKTCWLTLGRYGVHCLPCRCIVDLPRLGTAIRVAQTYHIDLGREHCPHLSDAEYARWRQVWRAIIFFDTSVFPLPLLLFAVLILLLQMARYRPWPKAPSP